MTDLRVITQAESWRQATQPALVERLESLLERAKSGELQSIAYAATDIDGATTHGFTELINVTGTLASLARLQHMVLQGEWERGA